MARSQSKRFGRQAVLWTMVVACGLVLGVPPAAAAPGEIGTSTAPQFIGEEILPTGLMFNGTEVGGLSGLAYDAKLGVYYAISDDRSQLQPARFYTLQIDLSDGGLDAGDVSVVDLATLTDSRGQTFAPLSLDPESIALSPRRTLIITSEGDASQLIPPWVREFSLSGRQLLNRPVPDYYDPTPGGTSGVRNNLAFESAGYSPDGDHLFTATENALAQDGPAATLTTSSPARFLRYDRLARVDREYVYIVEPVQEAPIPPDAFTVNGVVDVLPLSPSRMIVMERSFSVGAGNNVRLYLVDTAGATNVRGLPALPADLSAIQPVQKSLLYDFDALGITLDNLEGLALGPTLPDGRQSVLVVSDNNFSPTAFTQFLAFSI